MANSDQSSSPNTEIASEETKICPYCAETIKANAILCRFCQMDLRSGSSEQTSAKRFTAGTQQIAKTGPNPGVAAVLSLFVPGAGHIYCGRIGTGLGILLGTVVGYLFLVLPGLIIHISAICTAYTLAQTLRGDEISGQHAPNAGDRFLSSGQLDLAELEFKRALEAANTSQALDKQLEVNYRLAQIYLLTERTDEARSHLQTASGLLEPARRKYCLSPTLVQELRADIKKFLDG